MHVCVFAPALAVRELVLSSHHVGSWDKTSNSLTWQQTPLSAEPSRGHYLAFRLFLVILMHAQVGQSLHSIASYGNRLFR